jgi:RNA polymerase sigma factor (sigma-70 family)
MTPALLQAVVRVADARTSDAELLKRFVQSRDETAFEELVRRHGPLVWAVCRQLLPHHADAEDAFQAVFLALIQGAVNIRAGQALPAWLHGVAIRVSEKAKRTSGRRRKRETRAAVLEADRPVPDAAWASLMAAVHEEVQNLPDAERTAFILCELEGVRQPDAAARLGWPLGTLSGRLCKARQRLIDQLTRRGIVPGVVAMGGLAGAAGALPEALAAKVSSSPFALAGGVSSTVAALANGIVGDATMRFKVFAAALLFAGAVGWTGTSMFLSNAEAQTDLKGIPSDPKGAQADPRISGSSASGQVAQGGNPGGRPGTPGGQSGLPGGAPPSTGGAGGAPPPAPPGGAPGLSPPPGLPGAMPPGAGSPQPGVTVGGGVGTRWDYKFIDLKSEDRDAFEKEIKQAGTQGWEFCGSERLLKAQFPQLVLVFKKRHLSNEMTMTGSMGMAAGAMGGPGMGTGGFGGGIGGGGGFGGGPGLPGGPGVGPGPGGPPGTGPMGPGGPSGIRPGGAAPAPKPGDQAPTDPFGSSVGPSPGPMSGGGAGKTGGSSRGQFGGGPPGQFDTSTHKLTILKLKHAKAEELSNVLQRVFSGAEITPEPRTNQLIVRASSEQIKEVEKLLAELDVNVPAK